MMLRTLAFAFAFAFAFFVLTTSARSDDDLTVIKRVAGETLPGKRLYEALERQAKTHFDLRRQAIAALKTSKDIAARQTALQSLFRQSLGDMPTEKTPLNARVVRRKTRDGYRVENVIYESLPNLQITANLYIPDGAGPFPGVLVPCGHSDTGKAAETYQRISILLAKNGMAALCFDPIGQGERAQVLNASGKPAVGGGTTEHTLAGIGALLVGRSTAGYRLWDAVRSLDYLATRPEVDPKRLGCTGNSGGGTETAYLMAFDDRVLVAAPSCFITSLERLFATIGPQDAEQNLTGQVALGIEHADYITMRAPKPTLLCVGTRDFFDIDGSWTTFREVKGIYGRLGYGERVELFESDEPHGFTRPRRQASMRWMRRWLLDKNDSPLETDFPIAADKDLQCTETGQVLSAFHGTSVFELNAARAKELESNRATSHPGRTIAALREDIRKRIALPGEAEIFLAGQGDKIACEGYNIDRLTLTTEPGVTIPVRLFQPEPTVAPRSPVVMYVGADIRLGAVGGLIEARVKRGEWVAMVEPRGTGETAPVPPPRGEYGRGVFGVDEREAALSFHLNRPLLGQRVFDVLQALRAIAPKDGPKEFRLIGVGICGPIVLHVAILDDRVKAVEIESAIASWSDVVRTPVSRGQLSSVVPGVLESYDLPELAAALAPRPLTIRTPADAAGRLLSRDEAAIAYAATSAAYKAAGAAEKFEHGPSR